MVVHSLKMVLIEVDYSLKMAVVLEERHNLMLGYHKMMPVDQMEEHRNLKMA